MDIEVCLGENVLDLVDPLFGFPVFEDGRGVSGRAQGHVDRTHNVKTIATTWGSRASYNTFYRYWILIL